MSDDLEELRRKYTGQILHHIAINRPPYLVEGADGHNVIIVVFVGEPISALLERAGWSDSEVVNVFIIDPEAETVKLVVLTSPAESASLTL